MSTLSCPQLLMNLLVMLIDFQIMFSSDDTTAFNHIMLILSWTKRTYVYVKWKILSMFLVFIKTARFPSDRMYSSELCSVSWTCSRAFLEISKILIHKSWFQFQWVLCSFLGPRAESAPIQRFLKDFKMKCAVNFVISAHDWLVIKT